MKIAEGLQVSEISVLTDKQAISELIYRYCRALDRFDRELALSCWHPDGTVDYGALFAGPGSGFVDWVFKLHEGMERTHHNITNILIELDGDAAVSEAYWLVWLRIARTDGLIDASGGGRYVDRFEKINGVWKIRHRQCVFDWDRIDKVEPHFADPTVIAPNDPKHPTTRGLRGREDYSYKVGLPTRISDK